MPSAPMPAMPDAQRGRDRRAGRPELAGAGARAGADESVAEFLYAVVLEDRSLQSDALSRPSRRPACAIRDPRLCRGDARHDAALGALGARGLSRIPHERRLDLGDRAQGGPAHARRRNRRAKGQRAQPARVARTDGRIGAGRSMSGARILYAVLWATAAIAVANLARAE